MNSSTALHFVPLGGSGEIGMNFNAYGLGDAWLAVDCGIGFERDSDRVIMADPRFLARRQDDVAGLLITHVHLDHIGAVPDLWKMLRCPVHLTPLAATWLRPKLREAGLGDRVPLKEHRPGSRFQIGPFDCELTQLTHSTTEACGVMIRTPAARVFHTGDFKLDPEPLVGPTADEDALRRFGDEGVDAVVSDSTNATKPGRSGSEATVRDRLRELIRGRTGRVAVGLFSSNVARLGALAHLAEEVGRHPVVVGRSMERMLHAAHTAGYLRDTPQILDARDVGYLPPERVLLLCTGTQAEPGSALQRFAHDTHRHVRLDPGDLVIFSSKIIPGNEIPIDALHRALQARGIEVVHEGIDPAVHCSGHPCRDELAELYEMLRPTTVIPVHGEDRHLRAHADWARELGRGACEVRNGDVLHLGPGPVRPLGEVPHGRIFRDELEVPADRRRRR